MALRRVALLFNPISGSGRAHERAERIAARLASEGFEPTAVPTRPGPASGWLPAMLATSDAMLVVGGDGAVRLAAPAAASCGVPLYHVRAGTENLAARYLGMAPEPDAIIAALRAERVGWMDLGMLDGEPFVLMASIGFDADVVHGVAVRRGASISHATYVPVILGQIGRWRSGEIAVRIDDGPTQRLGHGVLVVANVPAYALRMDPARGADPTDGQLDVAFLPCAGSVGAVGWMLRCLIQRGVLAGAVRFRGARIEIESSGTDDLRWQADGDPLPRPVGARIARAWVLPGVLPVLLPALGLPALGAVAASEPLRPNRPVAREPLAEG